MKNKISFFCLMIIFAQILYSQSNTSKIDEIFKHRGEVYFSFDNIEKQELNLLSRVISIDKQDGNRWYAYANRTEFDQFLKRNIDYRYETAPSLVANKSTTMATNLSQMSTWDKYPTYAVYVQMMTSFQMQYPSLCKIDTIGFSEQGRLILSAKISSNLDSAAYRPAFFYSSTIHGDEVTGFVLMLRLIDYLLSNYPSDTEIMDLLEKTCIYINPNANPDGTYYTSNNNISGATRYNSNYVDLNRNYPDAFFGSPSNTIQTENLSMMDYVANKNIVMGANIHGGTEVFNFPWDCYVSQNKKHPDYDLFANIGHGYVDSCRLQNANAYSGVLSSGVVMGGDWYVVYNGRQDYMNTYHKIREVTLEISESKLLNSNYLPNYWTINKRSLINFIKQSYYGITGKITDSITKEPISARISIENRDIDSTHIYSNAQTGMYFRPIESGNYNLIISANGYLTKVVKNISVNNNSTTHCNIDLQKIPDYINTEIVQPDCQIFPNPATKTVFVKTSCLVDHYTISDLRGGIISQQHINSSEFSVDVSTFSDGVYVLCFFINNQKIFKKIIVVD